MPYVFVQLNGLERHAIPALRDAVGLAAKVKAFEVAFERAGAKPYFSRNQWASFALDSSRKPKAGPPVRRKRITYSPTAYPLPPSARLIESAPPVRFCLVVGLCLAPQRVDLSGIDQLISTTSLRRRASA